MLHLIPLESGETLIFTVEDREVAICSQCQHPHVIPPGAPVVWVSGAGEMCGRAYMRHRDLPTEYVQPRPKGVRV